METFNMTWIHSLPSLCSPDSSKQKPHFFEVRSKDVLVKKRPKMSEDEPTLVYHRVAFINHHPFKKIPMDDRMYTRKDLKVNLDPDLDEIKKYFSGKSVF